MEEKSQRKDLDTTFIIFFANHLAWGEVKSSS